MHALRFALPSFLYFIPLFAFCLLITYSVTNVPYQDDFDTALRFIHSISGDPTLSNVIGELFRQQTEHHVVFQKLLYLVSWLVTGKLNFAWLAVIGDLAIFGLLFLLWRSISERISQPVLAFLPAVFFLCQPQYYDSIVWSTASLANFCALLFCGMALSSAAQGDGRISTGAIVAATVASYTQALGGTIFGVLGWFGSKRGGLGRGTWWLLIGGIVLMPYLMLYESPPEIANAQPHSLLSLEALKYLSAFLGAAFGLIGERPAMIAGLSLGASWAAITFHGYYRKNLVVWGLLSVLVLASLVNTAFRVKLGHSYALSQPRYRFFSSALIALTYLGWIDIMLASADQKIRSWGSTAVIIGLIGAVVFWAASYIFYLEPALELKGVMRREIVAWFGARTGHIQFNGNGNAEAILRKAEGAGIYSVSHEVIEPTIARISEAPLPDSTGPAPVWAIDDWKEAESGLYIRGWAYVQGSRVAGEQKVALVFESASRRFLSTSMPVQRIDLLMHLREIGALNAGILMFIPKGALPADRYEVSIQVTDAESCHIAPTGRSFTVSEE